MKTYFEKTEGGVFVPVDMPDRLAFGGVWGSRVLDRHGNVKHDWEYSHNIVVNQGLDYFLDVGLSDGTADNTHYIGIFEGDYTPVAGDTAANIATNSTESTAYDEANRQTWVEPGVSGQAITNTASKAAFTMNASKTIYGAFLVSSNVKSGTAGTLIAAGRFASSRAVVSSDVLEVTYELTAADA